MKTRYLGHASTSIWSLFVSWGPLPAMRNLPRDRIWRKKAIFFFQMLSWMPSQSVIHPEDAVEFSDPETVGAMKVMQMLKTWSLTTCRRACPPIKRNCSPNVDKQWNLTLCTHVRRLRLDISTASRPSTPMWPVYHPEPMLSAVTGFRKMLL
ncbi:hypothetical protein T440DRAFT_248240 [Plenodomus tracheiphilus IPT5]|uniref:Uncharacterized protein n=1 Tax=Plenodomus tracheiphilus IPT5 TaxID=1408161 RepID=A0A6A7AVG8_9PLEO|nr:hypothetical protein T440DRAFT_248240 [Plenodomus tracheiphilus IPT5]